MLYVSKEKGGKEIDWVETQMMNCRFKVFTLCKSIEKKKVRECPACPRCFAHFVYRHSGLDSELGDVSE